MPRRLSFPSPNLSRGWKCPICRSDANVPVTLVPIPGTEDGNIVECQQVHAECIKLVDKMHSLAASPKPTE